MDYGMSAELEQFREEVRAFVAENAPPIAPKAGVRTPENREELELFKKWTGALFTAGYAGAGWPEEFGGKGIAHSLERDIVVDEEIARARAPQGTGAGSLVANALIDFGTAEQRATFLPPMRTGEVIWCQLFSEPSSGSDLASLRTRAVLQEDGSFRVNGQKVWTTNGHWADFGYLLARTDQDAPKHKGISAFIVDMTLPGVDVRPLREMTGTSDFNEVFLDDVVLSPDALIGNPGEGWKIANSSLAHERTGVATSAVTQRQNVDALIELARTTTRGGRPLIENARIVDELGRLDAAVESLSALVYANVSRWSHGHERVQDAPIAKLMFSELGVEIAEVALDILGESAVLAETDPDVVDHGRWQDEFLYARAYTIAGGSSEIMRNIIAERGLGLPR
ncbi:acyl-CoA dehydrogenase family protein [Gordonia sp. KTR9]|uniref:acyl-CoA dehydrogenase family protein n=1 Tax=Gordonia sp. KTR9 TaxID=337191 RepID=UPI00027DE9F6|nr:acyl-CoA dehydrogenase family protein [Gordonia sp. KTR9]AFR49433.1 2-methyl branched-chain acyl-CoA dehydrogenase / putative 2-methylacyl-CoA dehydrogenase [Gordonia sp. KTR9]